MRCIRRGGHAISGAARFPVNRPAAIDSPIAARLARHLLAALDVLGAAILFRDRTANAVRDVAALVGGGPADLRVAEVRVAVRGGGLSVAAGVEQKHRQRSADNQGEGKGPPAKQT